MDKVNRRTPLTELNGVGGKTAKKLQQLGVYSVEDLPFLFPRAYQDRRHPQPIPTLKAGTISTIRGQVLSISERRFRKRSTLEIMVSDNRGILLLKWFRYNKWFKNNLQSRFSPGSEIIATGKVDSFAGALEMHHPELSQIHGEEISGIVPIYPLTEGVHQHLMRRIIQQAVGRTADQLEEPIPPETLKDLSLPSLPDSVRYLHTPPDDADESSLNRGDSPFHLRVKFGELLFFQLGILRRKRELSIREGIPIPLKSSLTIRFLESLPFDLTEAQSGALGEIERDMTLDVPMHRLLQGDVGSGKTVVAFAAMLGAVAAGHQAILMAPTEVLAEQHFVNMSDWAKDLGIPIALFTGRLTGQKRTKLTHETASGDIPLIVGTHALIQEGTVFSSLALAVVDEQHRFGVMQRLALKEKGKAPHFLVMTATPIPRSMAMVIYGDLDLSTIDEIPPGRQDVQTKIFAQSDRAKLHISIAKEVREGRQVFIVYPLVEETERSELSAANEMADLYRDRIFPNLRIGLLTGRMSSEEKDAVMKAFRKEEYDILVSTTVIEVGVDVPNATLMVIEHAERFGLFQLHQLRGRVGRGRHSSQCILMVGDQVSNEARERLKVMIRSSSGFEIAEEDLRIRGPGDFLGTRQAGMPDFRYAHPMKDRELMAEAQRAAGELFREGGKLPDNLVKEVDKFWSDRFNLASSG
jgi:ATP-dependent DNA helicase RecG